MPDPLLPPLAGGGYRSRRALLALGLTGGILGWSGCTVSDPAIRPPSTAPVPPTSSPTPTPTPEATAPTRDAARAADVTAELRLAAGAAALATSARSARRPLLALLQAVHLERAAALAAPEPATRPTAAPSLPSDLDGIPATQTALVRAERAAARRHRTAASATPGLTALLHGSMAVASERFAVALASDDRPRVADLRNHRPLALVSDSEAVSALVASLHAAVWGYQLALGRLPVGSPAHARAVAGLTDRRALLRRLADRLVAAGVEVPPAAPAYDPSPEVRDAATAARLIRRMESALLPFCGLWLAAAPPRRPSRSPRRPCGDGRGRRVLGRTPPGLARLGGLTGPCERRQGRVRALSGRRARADTLFVRPSEEEDRVWRTRSGASKLTSRARRRRA